MQRVGWCVWAKHTITYGLNTLYLKEIIGRAHVENIASLKILQKIGMQFIKEEVVDNCPVKTFKIVHQIV